MQPVGRITMPQTYNLYDLKWCEKCNTWYVEEHKCEQKLLDYKDENKDKEK